MKKNIREKLVASEIIGRIRQLSVRDLPLWGLMNATEMVYHCNLTLSQVMNQHMIYQKPSFKQRVLKFLNFYIASKFPKNVRGAANNETRGHIDSSHFEEEKEKLISLVNQFADYIQPITYIHPAFGPLSGKQWGIATFMHLDHHLRQFGK